MADLQDINGAQTLRQAWPIIEANDVAINAEIVDHKASTTAHNATAIVFTPAASGMTAITVDAAIKEQDTRIDTIIAGSSPDKDAELVDIRTPNVGYTPLGVIAVAGDIVRDMQVRQVAHEAESAIHVGLPNGIDDTQKIMDAYSELPSTGGTIKLSRGVYKITSSLVFNTKMVVIQGEGHGVNINAINRAGTIILKSGSFDGIVLGVAGSKILNLQVDGDTGNTNDGIVVKQGRISLCDVAVTSQGNDGIRIGDDASATCNLWRLENVISLSNGRHGVYIHDVLNAVLPNTNAGYLLGLDARENGGDGLCIENSIDNIFLGVACQNNVGTGVKLKANALGHQFYGMYTEANTVGECVLDSGANRNMVFGYRSGPNSDGIDDNGTGNLILGRTSEILGTRPFFKSATAFKDLIIDDETISGYYELKQDPVNRNLNIYFEGSATTPVRAVFKHSNSGKVILQTQGLDIGDSSSSFPITGRLHKEISLDFTSIAAHTTSELTVSVPGVVLRDIVVATPESLVSGLMWNAYVSAVDTVRLRLANVTTSAIDPVSGAWTFDIWQS